MITGLVARLLRALVQALPEGVPRIGRILGRPSKLQALKARDTFVWKLHPLLEVECPDPSYQYSLMSCTQLGEAT